MPPILPGAPWLIAHRSMLGINQPYKVTLNGRDYVLWQTESGEISALDNICPHRQAPLSKGWVCRTGTLACPFHALEFDGTGRLHRDGKPDAKPIAKPLNFVVAGDLIWTYGGHEPKLPIPDLLERIDRDYRFIGVTGNRSIGGEFLTNLLTNYDFEHQNGTHRESFRLKSCQVSHLELDGYTQKLNQHLERDNNTWGEILNNPALLAMPKVLNNRFEYAFPSTTAVFARIPVVEVAQVHILYPETATTTRTFILLFGNFKHGLFKPLLSRSILKAAATIVEQDSAAVESLYPTETPKIRLPNEEILYYAEQLYRKW